MTIRARLIASCAAAAGAAVLAGCTSPAARPAAPLATGAAATHVAATPAASHSARPKPPPCNPEASSLAPLGPARVTPGSTMAKIRAHGHLTVGVDQNTYHFEYLNPVDGQIEGFDIDMVNAVAKAIFGTAGHVVFKAISDGDRLKDIENGTVDMVAHTMTITCYRLQYVNFSAVYFDAHRQVLVPSDSTAQGLDDLGGQRVCSTSGSDAAIALRHYPSHPILVTTQNITDCLLLLQQNKVAAICTDDTILDGLHAQDPFTKLVGPNLTNEPYGLAISKQQPDFVRFVNAVLAQQIASGAWRDSYKTWVSSTNVPAPPPQEYAK
jgi:polar amino acid transport system substrate-binding protein